MSYCSAVVYKIKEKNLNIRNEHKSRAQQFDLQCPYVKLAKISQNRTFLRLYAPSSSLFIPERVAYIKL